MLLLCVVDLFLLCVESWPVRNDVDALPLADMGGNRKSDGDARESILF